jgi:peptide/nickel transport system permease protein
MTESAITEVGFPETERRARRGFPITIALSFVLIALVAICAIFGTLIAPKDPHAQNLLVGVAPPSGDYWLGTDELGRDVLSRTIVGARTAVIGPVLIALGAMFIGNVLGLLAGYKGGWFDSGILRWADLMYALPGLLIAIVIVGVLGGGYFLAIVLLIFLTSPYDTRIVRGATLEQRPLAYVEAARTLGLSSRTIMARHIWPNILPFALANTFLNFAFALVTLSALSFLGLGVGPGTADWGRMLSESRTLLFDNPAAALAPGIMIVLTAACMNLIGDWFYETLSDRGRAR